MNLQELRILVQASESEQVEFKETTGQRSDAAKTVCAMLNGRGGFVLFGITNRGDVIGQQVALHTLEQVSQELGRIDPPSFPDIETVPVAVGSDVIVLRVPGGGGPYTYDGRAYLRHGPTTRPMPRQQYEQLLLERMHASDRWENQPARGIDIDDLDHGELFQTIEEAIRRQRMDDPGMRDPGQLLLGLGLVHKGSLLNAAVVLFGNPDHFLPHFPQCLLRMSRFRGRDKSEFLDSRQEIGHAFDLLQRAQRFLRDHLPVAGRIVPHLFERQDDPLYPPEALREAVANALCHRDYGARGGSIGIAIYDDRLEISSTGILPFGLTLDDLRRPHASRPWNPLIAQTFHRRGIIETWGRGTLKIIELTERAGLPAPEFEVLSGEMIVRFFPTRYVPPTRIGHNLSPLQRDLLGVLAQRGPSRLSEIRAAVGGDVPSRTLQDNLQLLRRLGVLVSVGQGWSARWVLAMTPTERPVEPDG